MARRGSSARAAALRRAQQAKAARDAARLSRQKDIVAALAGCFEASGQAERIHPEAQRKADSLLADAEAAAQAPQQVARHAVRRLRELLGSAAEVVSLCGITASDVRAMLAPPATSSAPIPAPADPPQLGRGGHGDSGDAEPPTVEPDSLPGGAHPVPAPGFPARGGAERRRPGVRVMPEPRLPKSWLASEVLMDPFLVQDARMIYTERGGADGYLAARRLLDERLRAMVHWPRARDCAELADDLAVAGRDDDAVLLRRVAATGALLAEAQNRWSTRYDARTETGRDRGSAA